jgi:hypothetical protein
MSADVRITASDPYGLTVLTILPSLDVRIRNVS